MALIKCPECNNTISNKAVTCPHCGFILQVDEASKDPKPETSESGGPLFSTRKLYNTPYIIIAVIYVVSYLVSVLFFAIVGVIVGGIIWAILFRLLTYKWLRRNKVMVQSYVDLYDDRVCGVTTCANTAIERGISFTIDYQDITHLDNISNHVVVIRTTHGDYQVQAYQCADKVRQMILSQKEALS